EIIPFKDGTRMFLATKNPYYDHQGNIIGLIGISHDITERKQAEDKLHVQNTFLKLLKVAAVAANEATDIKNAFQPILEWICRYTGWEIGHAYVISKEDPNLLEPTSVWWFKDHKHFKEFRDVSKEIKFARGIGIPGRVLASAKPHWIVDVTKDKNFLRTEISKALEIKSGIAFPVMAGTKVVAVLSFFTTKALEPDKQFMEIMAEVGTQLGRVVERKQAEEALCEASELNERIISESPIGLAIYDQTGQCIEANTSIAEMINATQEQVLAQNYNNIESWKKSGLLDAANKSIRLQEKKRHEFDIETTFGEHGFYDCLFVPFMLRGEQHLLFMIDDITERKQAEEMLLKSDERYRSLINDVLDTSNVGVFILDKEFRVVWINKALESYFGLKRDEVIMKNKRQLVNDNVRHIFEDGEKFKERVLKTYDDNTYVENFVCHILPGDGRKERWLEHWSQPIVSGLYAGGRVEHYTDITKRRLAEERIKGLAKFPSENPYPVLRVLNDGRILYNNQASMVLLDFWGCQTTRMLPDNYLKIVSDVLHSGLSNAVEVEFNNYVFSLTFAPVIEESYVNVYGLDITERKQLEEALLQSEKMKAMGIMTSGVAHEFNNILAVISSNAQLLEEANRNDKELTKTLLTICRMADDGAAIVDRMYEFTDIHKDTSKYFSMDLTDLIKQVIDYTMPRWKEMAHANGIAYEIDQGGIKTLPPILANPTEMREVFLNIINNSLDAMPDGGTITVMTRSVWGKKSGVWSKKEKDSKLDEDFVEISFEDTGKGMSDEVKNKVFDPFYTTRSPEGTGLGMSVSYGIITRHGGKIDIESKVGKGSKIIIKLPQIAKTINTEELPKPASVEKVGNLNVLVVDDEKYLCDSLSNFFKKDGHTVRCVSNGKVAIELLKNNDFDLLICDLVMPEVNGREVIKALDTLNKRPKVGLITAWNYKSIKDEDLNVDFVVKKPFNLSKLRRDINKIFSS
ncbi:MAG: PAS domain S-box protein, partial [Candidatus Scalindua sp.]